MRCRRRPELRPPRSGEVLRFESEGELAGPPRPPVIFIDYFLHICPVRSPGMSDGTLELVAMAHRDLRHVQGVVTNRGRDDAAGKLGAKYFDKRVE